jgi:hypothetical protein
MPLLSRPVTSTAGDAPLGLRGALGSPLPAELLSDRRWFSARCSASVRAIAPHAQFAEGVLAMAARPLASTVTVNSELHRSQSQKYSTTLFFTGALLCSEPEEDRCRSSRNNFPPRRYRKDAPHEGFAHLVTIIHLYDVHSGRLRPPERISDRNVLICSSIIVSSAFSCFLSFGLT